MRTSSIISYTAILASGTTFAFSFATPEQFDTSLMQARSFVPDTISAESILVKRAEGPWDCNDDEEYVPYEDGQGDDEDEEDSTPVFEPSKQGQVKAVAPQSQSQQQQQQTQQTQQTQTPTQSQSNNSGSTSTPAVKSSSSSSPSSSSSTLSTPENIAEGTYTAEEGCARFYTVKAGDICLKLVEDNKDLGLTLDQLYCLNPAIDDLCYNLWIGTSYCVGYNGEEPLNTGVSA